MEASNEVMTRQMVSTAIQNIAANNKWYSVCYPMECCCAVSNSGLTIEVMTSRDGINWTIRNSAADNN